ncbi:alpha/beta hydrolase [Siphonobacter sp. BAB-5385]|uniref:prolyl oligopeptidase family serine peptidase n=1 Tax=Siphonobacter sp. BAB-5385 TaxID=1864822 RepID=UPI000B9ED6CF|nr:prolyl oligopeptidase family serine peptidase [Siphonobacter sp. BAB-5385]OZI07940.1 alpha/beta hydrolase [Siphonobacter sp. BAB-5385]
MRKPLLIGALALSLGFTESHAQQVYHFTKGWVATLPQRYGREAIYTDELVYQMHTKQLKTPGSDSEIKWQAIEADSTKRLRARMSSFRGSGGPAGPGITPGSLRGGIGGNGGYMYLTYTSPKAQTALLNIKGNSQVYVNGELHMGDPYSMGYLHLPVSLKKGLNEFYVRGLSITANLTFPEKPVLLNTDDLTLPSVIPGNANESLQGALVVLNTTTKELTGLQIKSTLAGQEVVTELPAIPALSFRKVAFGFNGSKATTPGKHDVQLTLLQQGKPIDQAKLSVEAMVSGASYSQTFVSSIDGSLQYYAVTPQIGGPRSQQSLFLSVHGAGVEASGQARAYKPKDWGTLVAATNRRPRGFNWEDWGRLDALEVLSIAKNRFQPDPQHVYLTGHSMGGHGTWFLGATYPDQWAGIAPCAGYPTLKEYGSADGLIPATSQDPMEQVLLQSGNQSDVLKLVSNYKPLGVYVLHGDADRTVPVTYARQMKKILGDFHPDFSYYEYPGGEHWFGDQSVDWKPLFDYFKWHQRPVDSTVTTIDFMTANPGISSTFRWASIQQQERPLQYSRIQLTRNQQGVSGRTENVALLKLVFTDVVANTPIRITLDSLNALSFTPKQAKDSVFLAKEGKQWAIRTAPGLDQKGPHRYGTFKDAFRNRMVFVYSTQGTPEENEWSRQKARFDAESWYYRGNGAVDIIADKAYSLGKYADRGVILFGNAQSNAAWKILLADCPIQIQRNRVQAGTQSYQGDDWGAYFVWPIKGSNTASVAVVSGTGLKGMKAADANQYFAGASGFPDFMIYQFDMLKQGSKGVKLAGFYDNAWKLNPQLWVVNP